jgi:quinoprotein glucose dehydrogenase
MGRGRQFPDRAIFVSVTPGRRAAAWSIAVGLAGGVLVCWTTPHGAGLSPDSVSYVAAARWVLAGAGVRSLEGGPLSHFPPLYPIVLAAAAWVSRSDPLDAARWLNAALFAVLLALAGLLAARIGRRPAAGVAAALVLLASRDMLMLHAMAWSEPLAIVLGTAGLALVARHIGAGGTLPLALAAIGFGLAALARYAAVGYTLAGAAGLLLLDRTAPPRRRATKAATLALLAIGPLVLWWLLTGARIGLADRTLDFHPLGSWDLDKAKTTLMGWLAPPDVTPWVSGVSLAVLIGGLGALLLRAGPRGARTPSSPLAPLLLLFAAIYVAFIIACRMVVDAAILLDARILAPVQVALVIASAGIVAQRLPDPTPHRVRLALVAAVVGLIAAQGASTARWARGARADGLFYTKRSLRRSALLERVRALPPTVLLWTNAPDVVYILTGRCARLLPRRERPESGRPDPGFASGWRVLLGQPDAYVAWFRAFAWRSYLPSESELAASPGVTPVASVTDGTLYRIASSGAPIAAPTEPACPPARTAGRYGVFAIGATPTGAPKRDAAGAGAAVGWPQVGGDPGGMRYSPLADIDRSNVARLELAWTWRTGERGRQAGPRSLLLGPGKFEATPVMLGDTLFLTTPHHRVVALDAETGAQLWSFDPRGSDRGEVRNGHRFVHRGLAAWSGGGRRRLFLASRGRLYALDAATGEPVAEFGGTGVVDLLKAMGWSGNPDHVDNTSPPTVYHDLVIVGSSISDDVTYPGEPPGAVLAFDARSGRIRWIFRTIPRPGEQGSRTWTQSTANAGHANVWAPMTVDTARGLLYLPVSGASNDYYGGRRHGANLFAESLVCLDARTGKRKWHFQTVHHGLWDYDLPGPPLLATVRRGSGTQDIVAVAGKTGFVYVFDRVTGTPVWPIEELAVPASDVPGEIASPSQPFPTRPAPFVRQGFSEGDLVDFTPLLRDSARALVRGARLGPLFTPPSLAGTVVMPGPIGGAAWGGPAYDPENQLLFVKGNNQPSLVKLASPGPPNRAVDAELAPLLQRGWRWPSAAVNDRRRLDAGSAGVGGTPPELPIGKPPYGTLTAIDLATGEHRWQVTVGNWPELSRHPALRGVKLPPLGAVGTSGPIVTRGGLVFIAGGSTSLHALDAATGKQLWEAPIGGRGEANPMTYRTRRGRQFVVIASSRSQGGELMAFALPWR